MSASFVYFVLKLDEESDITLESFLSQIWDFNKNNTREKQKGIKLDFKSTDVFTNSLSILNKMWNTDYEIWLNAGNQNNLEFF